ncbi:class A sortase [Enterococcus faecium]|uniref:class A sortase n=1 Tax=Enterococcus faecium TaxID=1352 RepID=UPI0005B441EA|nr:class A sortase [Enterococcus faecium]AON61623.1 class A sortase [Enterococcus faecium]MBV6383686.1 class A sortase [Enterococcus faecium]OSP63784.1 class A sortase [Enterococcus faecium]PJO08376.1 class A sortase [Enterococcus faecium]PLQ09154.1 class A sortase [Enterococcus faecium]
MLLFLLLLVGLALIFNEQIKDYFVRETGDKYAIANVTKEDLKKNNDKDVSFDFDAVEPMTTEGVMRSQMRGTDLPVIASIAVPSVSINLPVFKGLDNTSLLYGAGTLSPDQEMGKGNYALASHRATNPELLFTPLENLEMGAKIYLTDLENVYTYKTFFKEKVAPTDTQLLNEVEGKEIVTLITCGDMDAVTRLVVQGELESVTSIKDATDDMRSAFNLETKTF